jgi:hypothetical protein
MTHVTFGIPFVSRRVAPNWASVQNLLASTLGSLFNQEGADVRVIIACHESPDIPEVNDPRVTIVNVDFDIPRWRWEMQIDQLRKMEVIGSVHRKAGEGWLFMIDADDLASRRLAKTILDSRVKAIIIQRGFRLDAKRGVYQIMRRFYGKCGSCAAVNWAADELPLMPLTDPSVMHEMLDHRHYQWPKFFKDRGWSVRFLTDPMLVYNVNHGSNQSDVNIALSLSWRLYFLVTRWRHWTPELDREFGVNRPTLESGLYLGNSKFSVARTDWSH